MKSMIKYMKHGWLICAAMTGSLLYPSCNNYLDIVPDDGLASLETAFSMRSTTIRYLYTCYAFRTFDGRPSSDAAFITGDELWSLTDMLQSNILGSKNGMFNIAMGLQNANSPYGNDWNSMYQAIRCCNIFIERAPAVPDLPEWEKLQWIAEAKFLKAYYHFNLIRKWGPIPLVRENLPITAGVDEVRVFRDPIDDCFDYIIGVLDEAIPDLPLKEQSMDELGRVTQPAAAALKAKICVYAASPLFNNNPDQATLVDKRGTQLFRTDKTPEEVQARWDSALVACREAVEICERANISLHKHQSRVQLNDALMLQLDLRTAITEKWNEEIIWTNTRSIVTSLQNSCTPNLAIAQYPDAPHMLANIQAPLKIAEMFYTSHGLPIENDKDWTSTSLYSLRTGTEDEQWYIRENYTTANINFNREPRFYAWLGFDGGIWYGQRLETNDPLPKDLLWISCRLGQPQQKKGTDSGPVTGYFLKKMVNYNNRQTGPSTYDRVNFPWPMIRLADLYLLYAEAINEAEGPNGAHKQDLFNSINKVRERAGIPTVEEAWDQYSNVPGKYSTLEGMREIIHRERLIELSFESNRYWDLRRWKEAYAEYSKGIYGYNVMASKPEDYYRKILISEQAFTIKNYFWPIQTALIEQNPNLIQNLGW